MKEILMRQIAMMIMLFIFICGTHGQVTVGSGLEPNKLALLDLKTQQENGAVSSISDDKNVTSTAGGLLLPRVKLVSINTLEPFMDEDDPDFTGNTNSLKEKLAGLMVYNITNNGIGSTLYPAVYTWNGVIWTTSQINEAASSIVSHPEPFTFYETGTEEVMPLTFKVDGLGVWTYQWYRVVGGNVHVRAGEPVMQGEGFQTSSYKPTQIIRGTTRISTNTGFYKFYCVAKSSLGAEFTSNIAEVAVGCGAKNKDGEWLSFMCFNLGADNNHTIKSQKEYTLGVFSNNADNSHPYIVNEEKLWGDLFQWGRIPDGHEKRLFLSGNATNIKAYNSTSITADIINGSRCGSTGMYYPFQQIKEGSNWYGKFIYGISNWYPTTTNTQSVADALWVNAMESNDPCYKYKEDGTYVPFWHTGTNGDNSNPACADAATGWRLPTTEEWCEIYRGGTLYGLPENATANTWRWDSENGRGYDILPDNKTSTLFLPAGGFRYDNNGILYNQGAYGSYWTSSVVGIEAYELIFNQKLVNPAVSSTRASGNSIRCVKRM